MSVAGDLKCPYCGKVNPRSSGALGLVGGLKKTCLYCGKEFEMKSSLAPNSSKTEQPKVQESKTEEPTGKNLQENEEKKAQEFLLKTQLSKFTTEQLRAELARRQRDGER